MSLARICLAALLSLLSVAAVAQDVPGSAEHPLLPMRFPESQIIGYAQTDYDAVTVATGEIRQEGVYGERLDLEGAITDLTYRVSAERSTVEVFRAYADALDERGFERLFACANEQCGGRGFNLTLSADQYMRFGGNQDDQRYLVARLADRPEGAAYAVLYVVKAYSLGGADQDAVFARLWIIETDQGAQGLELVAAEEMESAIGSDGAIALYGILFAYDSAEILPESRPTLDEIARLLAESPDLDLYVVGHTDASGSLDYNRDLSLRRAQSVVADLVASYAVDPARLTPQGVAFLAPVASNATEAGRALNRRVELVER